jgi:hypothetical protein
MIGLPLMYVHGLIIRRKFNMIYFYEIKRVNNKNNLLFSFHLTNHSGLGGFLKSRNICRYWIKQVYTRLNSLTLVD